MRVKTLAVLGIVLGLFTSAALAAPAATVAAPARSDASKGEPKKDSGSFLKMHESFLKRGKEGPIGVLFLGDSITAGWGKAPEVWEKYYKKYNPANFGIGGDRTEHVIWRIENGELDGICPKVVVLMLGTNNSGANSAEEIAAADKKIVSMIQARLPKTKVLMLAIFPRGPRPPKAPAKGAKAPAVPATEDSGERMKKIKTANAILAKLDNGRSVRFLDIGPKFLGPDGKIPMDVMPDQLHPNVKGYQIWADAMQPLLDEMMK